MKVKYNKNNVSYYKLIMLCVSVFLAICSFGMIFDKIDFQVDAASWSSYVAEPKKDTNGVYLIEKPENLAWMIKGYKPSASYKLIANLNMSKNDWTPIPVFTGNFDGNGHSITGIKCNRTSSSHAALIQYLGESAKVYNLSITDSTFKSASYAAAIAADSGFNNKTSGTGTLQIYNCTISNCTINATYNGSTTSLYVGAAVGFGGYKSKSLTLKSIYSINNTITGTDNSYAANVYVGGIAGKVSSVTSFESCLNDSNITATNSKYPYAGGIVGYSEGAISLSGNNKSVTAGSTSSTKTYAGGVAGYSTKTIKNCFNYGSVTAKAKTVTEKNAVGDDTTALYDKKIHYFFPVNHYSTIRRDNKSSDCYTQYSTTSAYAAGIVGWGTSTVSNCYNTGSFSGGRQDIVITRALYGKLSNDGWNWLGWSDRAVRHYFYSSITNNDIYVSPINANTGVSATSCYSTKNVSTTRSVFSYSNWSGDHSGSYLGNGSYCGFNTDGNLIQAIAGSNGYLMMYTKLAENHYTSYSNVKCYLYVETNGNKIDWYGNSFYAIDHNTKTYTVRYTNKTISSSNVSSTLGSSWGVNSSVLGGKPCPKALYWVFQ